MEKNARPKKSCSDCEALTSGSRTTPHQYLVPSRWTANRDSNISAYLCLVCRSSLALEPTGTGAKWAVGQAEEL